jgi:subtilisin family serine protease
MSFTEYALNSAEAAQLRQDISEQKAQVLTQLDAQGIAYTTGRDYDTLLSGFEIEILAKDFNATCKSLKKGQGIVVSEVYQKTDTQLVENKVTVYDTGIFDTSGCQYDGSGMVVAVLDTGLDSNHTAFSVDNFTSDTLGMTYEDVAAVVKLMTISADKWLYWGDAANQKYVRLNASKMLPVSRRC